MTDYGVSLPLIPFNVVYTGRVREEDRVYEMKAVAIPRVGERIIPQAGATQVIVTAVIHKPISHPELGFFLSPTVVVQDIPAHTSV